MQAARRAEPLTKERTPGVATALVLVAFVVVVLDQITKVVAVAALTPGETTPVVDGVLHWTLQRNPGAAFGMFQRFPAVFTVLAFAISIGILVSIRKVPDRSHGVALGLVLGGAAGNLVDRMARDPGPFRGHVVDFIDLRVWPVFNVADSAIVVGAIVLVLVSLRADRAQRRAAGPSAP